MAPVAGEVAGLISNFFTLVGDPSRIEGFVLGAKNLDGDKKVALTTLLEIGSIVKTSSDTPRSLLSSHSIATLSYLFRENF